VLTIYIGYDSREPIAYDVLVHSIRKHASKPVNIQPLNIRRLKQLGLITRHAARLNGVMYDLISDAPQSTEFAVSRFLPIVLQQTGWAVFMDSDMLFLDDIYKLEEELDGCCAAMCVKHEQPVVDGAIKMDGQPQVAYSRKNWSSFYAINCDHPSNLSLGLREINEWPGRYLHNFGWLKDKEIGALTPGWNWLVNVQDKPATVYNAHYTLGGPWFPEWVPQEYDSLWLDAVMEMKRGV